MWAITFYGPILVSLFCIHGETRTPPVSTSPPTDAPPFVSLPSRAPRARTQVAAFSATAAAPAKKYKVGVLGATGAVGQRFLQYLEGHPWFEVTSLGASERSAGKKYEDATSWQLTANLPDFVRGKTVSACSPTAMPNVDFVFSALVRDTDVKWKRCCLQSGRVDTHTSCWQSQRAASARRCPCVAVSPRTRGTLC